MLSNFDPVALLVTTTVTPGSTPPPSSFTTPATDEVAPPCAEAADTNTTRHKPNTVSPANILMTPPQELAKTTGGRAAQIYAYATTRSITSANSLGPVEEIR